MTIKERFNTCGIIPVIVLNDTKDAIPLAKALLKGGIDIVEITFRTDAAEESIRVISKEFPEMLVGAGTIINLEQLEKAYKAGAKFIVSPGFDKEIVDRCKELGLDIFPGAVTPTEIIQLTKENLEVAKFFPASNYGGLTTIKSLSGPFTNIKFIPTGGIDSNNLKEYLESNKVLAVGGSWICNTKLIEAGRFDEITKLTKEAKDIYKTVRG